MRRIESALAACNIKMGVSRVQRFTVWRVSGRESENPGEPGLCPAERDQQWTVGAAPDRLIRDTRNSGASAVGVARGGGIR